MAILLSVTHRRPVIQTLSPTIRTPCLALHDRRRHTHAGMQISLGQREVWQVPCRNLRPDPARDRPLPYRSSGILAPTPVWPEAVPPLASPAREIPSSSSDER